MHKMCALFSISLVPCFSAFDIPLSSGNALSLVVDSLDHLYLPFEQTAMSLARFVETSGEPFTTPHNELTTPSRLQAALWTGYEDVKTNGIWVGYNDSGIVGYWNTNGKGGRNTQFMYRKGGHDATSGCPALTTTAACVPSAWTTAPPTSCKAIPTGCQVFYDVDANGRPTVITKQRSYDTVKRSFWRVNDFPGQSYWMDYFGSFYYQSSDYTVPLLVGYFVAPITDAFGETKAIVLIQLDYEAVNKVLSQYNGIDDIVVYIIEASTGASYGNLVASSNGESIFNASSGSQKAASRAISPLISLPAAYLGTMSGGLSGAPDGSYIVPNSNVQFSLVDYKRHNMHHKIVFATHGFDLSAAGAAVSAGPSTVVVSADTASNTVMVAGIVCITLSLVFMFAVLVQKRFSTPPAPLLKETQMSSSP